MNKRFHFGKGLPIWIAVSALLIVVGVVLAAVLGFNYTKDTATLEIGYDSIVKISGEKREALEKLCEDEISAAGLKFSAERTDSELDTNYGGETGDRLLVYTFRAADGTKLLSVAKSIEEKTASNATFADASIKASVHLLSSEHFYEASWRGAIALAVAAVVALVYVGVRFGVGSALAGLVACVNDSLLTLAVFAIARIPVAPYGPLLFAGIAATLSLFFWIIQCMKMRENFKDPAFGSLSAAEAVEESCAGSYRLLLFIAAALAVVLVLLGGIAASGVRLFMLPALIPLAVSLYSSLLLAPAVLVPIKAKFDRIKSKHKRYAGKKKAEPETEPED